MGPEVVVEGGGLGLRQAGVLEAAEDLVEDVELVAVLLLLAVAAGGGGVRVGVGGGGRGGARVPRRRPAAVAVGCGVLHRH